MADTPSKLRDFLRIALIAWFLIASLYIFIPAYKVISTSHSGPHPADLPPLPELQPIPTGEDAAKQIKAHEARLELYDKQVEAWKKSATAKKTGLTNTNEAFELVAKETLVTLVGQFLTAFFGYVFVNAGAQLLGQPPEAQEQQDATGHPTPLSTFPTFEAPGNRATGLSRPGQSAPATNKFNAARHQAPRSSATPETCEPPTSWPTPPHRCGQRHPAREALPTAP